MRNEWPTTDEIIRRLRNPRGGGAPRRIPCPAHGGEHNNLAISDGTGGAPAVFCHSQNCDTGKILDALRAALGMPAFRPGKQSRRGKLKPRRREREHYRQKLNRSFAVAEAWMAGSWPILTSAGRASKDTPARKYLLSRGIDRQEWPLRGRLKGYGPVRSTVRTISADLARKDFRGIPPDAAQIILFKTEDYADSLRFIGLQAEAVTADGRRCNPTPGWDMKRRTFGNARRGIFRAGGPGGSRDGLGPLVIAEGPIDALVIAQRLNDGVVVGLPGTSGFRAFGRHLAKNPSGAVVIVETDGDKAGRKAADDLCQPLFHAGRPFCVIERFAGRDPAEDYLDAKEIDYNELV